MTFTEATSIATKTPGLFMYINDDERPAYFNNSGGLLEIANIQDAKLQSVYNNSSSGTTILASGKPYQLDSTVAGFISPRMTTAQFNAITKTKGENSFSNDENRPLYYDGTTTQKCAYLADISAQTLQESFDAGNEILVENGKPLLVRMPSPTFGSGENSWSGGTTTLNNVADRIQGWRFVVGASDLRVISLQYVDANFTAGGVRQIGLYEFGTETLLAQTTIAKTDPLVSGFRTKSITPVTLSSGQTYVISCVVPAGENFYVSTSQTPSSFITVPGAADGPNTSTLQYPATFQGNANQILCGGFQLEPITYVDEDAFEVSSDSQTVNSFKNLDMNGKEIINIENISSGNSGFIVQAQTGMSGATIVSQSYHRIGNVVHAIVEISFTATSTVSTITFNALLSSNPFVDNVQARGAGSITKSASGSVWEGKVAWMVSVNTSQTVRATINTVDSSSQYSGTLTFSYELV
jgi:hypothetical protein